MTTTETNNESELHLKAYELIAEGLEGCSAGVRKDYDWVMYCYYKALHITKVNATGVRTTPEDFGPWPFIKEPYLSEAMRFTDSYFGFEESK